MFYKLLEFYIDITIQNGLPSYAGQYFGNMYKQFLIVVVPVHKSFIVLSFQMPTIVLFSMNGYHIGLCYEPDDMLSNYNAQRYKAQRCCLLIIGYGRLCPSRDRRFSDLQILSDFQFKLYPPVCLFEEPWLANFVFLCDDF